MGNVSEQHFSRNQEDLNCEIRRLAAAPLTGDGINSSIEVFCRVYCDEGGGAPTFRHMYSQIATIVYDGAPPSDQGAIAHAARRAQMLSSNLDQVQEELKRQEKAPETLKSFDKLRDHVALEMQHLTVFESLFDSQTGARREIEKTRNEVKRESESIKVELEKHTDEMANMRREYIAILGIFAAVVLVINSGIGFSLSGIQALVSFKGYSVALLPLVLLIVGFVVLNTTALLFAFVWKLVQKDRVPKWVVRFVVAVDIGMLVGAILSCRVVLA